MPQQHDAPPHCAVTCPPIAATELAGWIKDRAESSTRYLFGIAGAPGSGKSTIAAQVADQLEAVMVPMDGFHLPNHVLEQQGLLRVKGAPRTFDAQGFVDTVRALRRADGDVCTPDFDRVMDDPRPNRIVVPASARIVIVDGNYLLLDSTPWSDLRDQFDAVAHLDIDAATRVKRLVDRHVEFGKTQSEASEFVRTSDEPNAALVEAVRHRAHLFVEADR